MKPLTGQPDQTRIRRLEPEDYSGVLAIYNHYVRHSHATFDIEPFDLTTRRPWFDQFDRERHVCLVALRGDSCLGYACSAPFKPKPAYRTSVEVSVYIAPDQHRQGVAAALYEALFAHLHDQPLHRAYAGIALPNDASMALHQRFGFTQAGCFREVGYKFDRYWDVAWLEKALP